LLVGKVSMVPEGTGSIKVWVREAKSEMQKKIYGKRGMEYLRSVWRLLDLNYVEALSIKTRPRH
jgi:hypothetical protein